MSLRVHSQSRGTAPPLPLPPPPPPPHTPKSTATRKHGRKMRPKTSLYQIPSPLEVQLSIDRSYPMHIQRGASTFRASSHRSIRCNLIRTTGTGGSGALRNHHNHPSSRRNPSSRTRPASGRSYGRAGTHSHPHDEYSIRSTCTASPAGSWSSSSGRTTS